MASRGTPPRSAASHAISPCLGVGFCRSAGDVVGSGLRHERAEGVWCGRKLAGPLLVIAEFVEQPACNTVLFLVVS